MTTLHPSLPGICGHCGTNDPYPVAKGYQASIVADPTPANPSWRSLGPTRQARLAELIAAGLTPAHHQCCIIHVLLDGRKSCPACAASRELNRRRT